MNENPLLSRLGKAFFQRLPASPGVYFMCDEQGEFLYIGKAKNLRSRLRYYARARAGQAPERILELVENIAEIRVELCPSEAAALRRESELLHAVRPPFNLAGTWEEHYLFIGIQAIGRARARHSNLRVNFQLSSRPEISQQGYLLHGCYKNRVQVKAGYTALLRLFHACLHEGSRFSYPARITRSSPPWLYPGEIPADWERHLRDFLSGRSLRLLKEIVIRLLDNPHIPRFMTPSIQEDIATVRIFYEAGPRSTYQLKKLHGLRKRLLDPELMESLIAASARPRAI